MYRMHIRLFELSFLAGSPLPAGGNMKFTSVLLLSLSCAMGQTAQTPTASISGTVLDAKTQEPVPAALVMVIQSGAPPFSRNTKTGADGAFEIQAFQPASIRFARKRAIAISTRASGTVLPHG
jgi:hypothetical protein